MPRPSLQPASSTSHYFSHTPPTPVAHNNGATASASSTFYHTPTTTTTSSLPIPSTSSSTSIPTNPNVVTTNTATSTLAPQLSAYPTVNTIAAPNSNNFKTTFPFLQNSLYVIGIPTTTSTTTPLSNSPPMIEHHYIANWMPSLNWPFISHHLKLKAQGWQFAKHRAHFYSRLATHKRLFRRLRQRQYTLREPHLYTSTKHHALQILRNLTKHTAASFEAAKQLRSGRHTDLEVYAIRRMAANLEEPGRSRALHILNKALIYRNLTPPKPNIPLTVPFLAHDDFPKHCQQWLRTTIQQHKHFTIPLHLPSHRLREAAHKTLRSHLHNHRTWEDTLHSPPDPADLPCACDHLRTLLQDPETPTVDGHYILTLDQLQLPTHLGIFLNANMNSTYYPSKARYFLIFKTAYTKWLKLQGLPPSLVQHLQPFLEHQWRLHNIHLKQQPRFTARLLRQLQEHLGKHTLLHHADHELQQLRLFCPRQYFTGALNTWQSPELFEPLPYITAANIHDHLAATVPPILRNRYKWGFRKDFNIPYGVVHLKEKKHWQKGRTIISYFQSLSGNLLRITSRALDIILQHLYPQHPGQMSIPQLWHHFHSYLTQTPPDISLHATNDDLVGFFNSVPQHRLIDAVHSLVHHWQQQHSTHTLTVDVQATGNPFHHSHIGRHHQKHPTQRTIQTSDITTIVAFALNTCIFRACNHTYKQIRGAGIGSQLSPALCNVAITLIEHSWHQIHNNLLQHTDLHFTYYRYVDNRFIVHNEHFLQHPAIQTLIHHNFFGDPVELEPVEDFHLLGFNIDLPQRTITHMQPSQPWKIRDSTTAGSQRLALSGLQSRLHTIRKYTFPPSSADLAAAELVNLYVQKGHNYHACHRFLKKRRMRRPVCVPPWTKGFSTTTTPQAGACSICGPLHATKLRPQMGRDQGRLILYLQNNTLTPMVHPAAVRWFHGFFLMIPSQKTGFPPPLLQLLCAASSPQSRETTFVQTPSSFSDFSPCCSTAILPNVVTEFTEYKCQSVLFFSEYKKTFQQPSFSPKQKSVCGHIRSSTRRLSNRSESVFRIQPCTVR